MPAAAATACGDQTERGRPGGVMDAVTGAEAGCAAGALKGAPRGAIAMTGAEPIAEAGAEAGCAAGALLANCSRFSHSRGHE